MAFLLGGPSATRRDENFNASTPTAAGSSTYQGINFNAAARPSSNVNLAPSQMSGVDPTAYSREILLGFRSALSSLENSRQAQKANFRFDTSLSALCEGQLERVTLSFPPESAFLQDPAIENCDLVLHHFLPDAAKHVLHDSSTAGGCRPSPPDPNYSDAIHVILYRLARCAKKVNRFLLQLQWLVAEIARKEISNQLGFLAEGIDVSASAGAAGTSAEEGGTEAKSKAKASRRALCEKLLREDQATRVRKLLYASEMELEMAAEGDTKQQKTRALVDSIVSEVVKTMLAPSPPTSAVEGEAPAAARPQQGKGMYAEKDKLYTAGSGLGIWSFLLTQPGPGRFPGFTEVLAHLFLPK